VNRDPEVECIVVDSTLTDDALRKLISEAGEILASRRKRDLAGLIRGMTDDELRDLIRRACEELDRSAKAGRWRCPAIRE
jgi:lipopolysaccharide biosynthesis regulator YciM